jgi:hypothetical protein
MTTTSLRRRSTGLAAGTVAAVGLVVVFTGTSGQATPPNASSDDHADVIAQPWIHGILGAPAEGAPPPGPEGPAFTPEGNLVFVSAFGDAEGNKVY